MFTYSDMNWRERLVGFVAIWVSSTLGLSFGQVLVAPLVGSTFEQCFDRVFFMSAGCLMTLIGLLLTELFCAPRRLQSEIRS